MIAEPGTFLWLLAHDLRLNWRRFAAMLGDAGNGRVAALVAAGAAVLHLLAWPVVPWVSKHLHGAEATTALPIALVVCTFAWMIAQGLFGVTRTLYTRGDLDLLLGSPVPAGRIFAAKATAIAASTLGSVALLSLPIANVGALIDRTAWLGLYPALIGLALVASSIGLALSIALFFLAGPQRARLYTHMMGAGIAGAFALGVQIVAMLPEKTRFHFVTWLDTVTLSPDSPVRTLLWMPIDAIRGDVGAMIALTAIGLALFTATVSWLGPRFARASLAAAGASTSQGGSHGLRPSRSFTAGLGRNLRRKEWRLLIRDQSAIAQIALQIIYTIPIAVVLQRSETLSTALVLSPTIVVIAAQVAASLAWITVSGEDAPELIATAPVATTTVERAKLSAVIAPMLAILALPLLALAIASWRSALLAALFAAGAAISTALLNFWHPMPGNRRGMLRRHSQSKLVALVEHSLACLWAIAVVLALAESLIALLPIGIALLVLWFSRGRSLKNPGRASAGSGTLQPPLRERTA